MLIDSYARKFKYLRLSLTEKCNFKCSYCLPNGYKGCPVDYLNISEISNLAHAFKDLGVEKVRLTGGEPTLRSDLLQLIKILKDDVGIQQVALTTNGFRLENDIVKLKEAGLDSLNVSMDSLRTNRFKEICGVDKGESIQRAVDQALTLGFKNIKINSVLLNKINDDEMEDFSRYIESRDVTVRFIELMRTGDNAEYFAHHHLSVDSMILKIKASGWQEISATKFGGPAKEFQHNNFKGRMGFISPYSKNFCDSCNRLRVSSRGGLKLCLFGQGNISLRHLLQREVDRVQLKEVIVQALQMKPKSHRLHEKIFGTTYSLSAIGG